MPPEDEASGSIFGNRRTISAETEPTFERQGFRGEGEKGGTPMKTKLAAARFGDGPEAEVVSCGGGGKPRWAETRKMAGLSVRDPAVDRSLRSVFGEVLRPPASLSPRGRQSLLSTPPWRARA